MIYLFCFILVGGRGSDALKEDHWVWLWFLPQQGCVLLCFVRDCFVALFLFFTQIIGTISVAPPPSKKVSEARDVMHFDNKTDHDGNVF